jgi:capsular polysaccharide biosynthesis protein
MNIQQFFSLIGRKKQTIASALIVFLAIAIIFSAVQPFKYGSSLTLLTIHSFSENIDPYVASKSNEYLSNLLSQIVYSGSFFAKVKESGFKIDKNYFSGSEKKQIKKWAKTVKAKSIGDTGMITIDVYHSNRAQAEEIARAVAYTLQTTHSQYHGFGNSVEIKIIDEPLTSNYPVKPNLPLNLALAVIFALFFSFCYIYLFPEERYDFRLWPKRKAKFFAEIEFNEQARSAFTPALAEEVEEDSGYMPESVEALNNYRPEDYQHGGSMNNVLKTPHHFS